MPKSKEQNPMNNEVDAVQEPQTVADIDELLATPDMDSQYVALPAPYKGGIWVRPLTMLEIKNARKSSMKRVRTADGITQELDEALLSKSYVILCVEKPAISPAQYDSMLQKNWALLEAIIDGVNVVNGFTKPAPVEGEVDPEVAAEF